VTQEAPRLRASFEKCERLLTGFETWSTKHRTLFWTAHSLWALATGVLVVVVAHERYEFVPWIFGMLAVTWISTLFFSRRGDGKPKSSLGRLGDGFVSYLTRVMYQETLFFLLPFYAYSTALAPAPAWSAIFAVVLAALAVLSCLDLVFDRILRDSPLFALLFFSIVAFAALNFLLPVVFRIQLDHATTLAAWIAVVSGLPLSFWGRELFTWRAAAGVVLACGFALGLSASAWIAVPPVPLRLQEVVFARNIERDPLRTLGVLPKLTSSADLAAGKIGATARIFSPTRLQSEVYLTWDLDGVRIRDSRRVDVETHSGGFRVWDVLTFKGGEVPTGVYRLSVFTAGRLLGRRELVVAPVTAAPREPASGAQLEPDRDEPQPLDPHVDEQRDPDTAVAEGEPAEDG